MSSEEQGVIHAGDLATPQQLGRCACSPAPALATHSPPCRPAIEQHMGHRAEKRRKRLLHQTQATLLRMRACAAAGRAALDSGVAGGSNGVAPSLEPPDPALGLGACHGGFPSNGSGGGGTCCASSSGHLGRGDDSDYFGFAYSCFSQAGQLLKVRCPAPTLTNLGCALHLLPLPPSLLLSQQRVFTLCDGCLQELALGPSGVPAGFLEAMEEEALQDSGGGGGDGGRSPHCVAADEQASIYSGWVEAALLKARCVLV